jgi:uncharacterized membrane protein YoaK (UPF0700 family)
VIRRAVAATLLAAAAGAVDLVALVALGGAFAGIVTGNLVNLGDGLVGLDARRLAPLGIAIGGVAIGVLVWARAWRGRPEALAGPLLAELATLVVALPFWLAGVSWPVLLLAGVALGGQSVVGLRLRYSTTYMTGVLTAGAHDLATRGDWRGALAAVRQLLALVAGAVAAAALLATARWAALLLPVVLVAASTLLVRVKPAP